MRITLVLLALILTPAAVPAVAAADAAPPDAHVMAAPAFVPADGAPFAVRVRVDGAPGAEVDVRVTVQSGSVDLARTWTGAAWGSGSRYALTVTLDEAGRWSGSVGLRLTDPAPAGADVRVAARARGDAGPGAWDARDAVLATPAYAAAVPGLARDAVAWLATANGTRIGGVTVTDGVPVLAAPDVPGPLYVETPDALRPAPALPAARVTRVDPAADELHVVADGDVGLAGVCAVRRHHRACVTDANASTATLGLSVPAKGGTLTLALGPVTLEAVTYPRVSGAREAVRAPDGAWQVTRPGRTAFTAESFPVDAVTPYTLPGDGYGVVAAFLDDATRTLDVQVFTLQSPAIARLIADVAERGVTVRVLVDPSPPGGMAPEERRLLAALADAGVQVRAGGSEVRAHHGKVAVADGAHVLVASENWNPGGYPAGASDVGNRGWGVTVTDAALAARLAEVFRADWQNGRALDDLPGPEPLPPAPTPPVPTARVTPADAVTVVLAPDDAERPVLTLLGSASRTVDVQQLSVDPAWGARPNAFLDAVVDAARRGVAVRVLLDGSFGSDRNRVVVDTLNGLAARENLTLEARLGGLVRAAGEAPEDAAPRAVPGVTTLHNKGVIVDGERALVGSLNWVRAAVEDNREVALVVDAPDAVAVYATAFDADWAAAAAPAPTPASAHGVPAPGVVALAVVVAAAGGALSSSRSPSCPGTGRPRRVASPRTRREGCCRRARSPGCTCRVRLRDRPAGLRRRGERPGARGGRGSRPRRGRARRSPRA